VVHKSSALAASSGSTGGGTVSDITSTGGTLSVTNPGGPTTNIDVANNTPNTLAGFNNSGVFSDVVVGLNLSLSGGTLSATAGGGGSISGITSVGGTIIVTNPSGATTNIDLAHSSLTVSGVSGVTGGGVVALGSSITLGMADSTANTLAGYNNNGVFSDISIGSNLSLAAGVLNGTVGPAPVSSIFGRTGAVVADYGDYAFNQISGVASVSQGGTG
jgi:hypothetical protein